MDPRFVASLALSSLIGLMLGVFGGGGSILAVPMLVFVARVSPSAAIGMSLAIVGATSLVAGYAHHQRRQVRFEVALLFGGTGIVTAFLGARLTHLVSGQVLMSSFAALMVLVGGWMLVGAARRARPPGPRLEAAPERQRPRALLAAAAGAVVGAITGFLGVGGGFLVVPALIAFTRLDMREAVGTSLLVIALNSAAGFVGHIGTGDLDVGLVAALTLCAVTGALAGERMGRTVSIEKLRRGFAVFVIAVGIAVGTSSVTRGVAHASGTREQRREAPSATRDALALAEWRSPSTPGHG